MADDAHVARVLRWLPFMRGKRYVSISQYKSYFQRISLQIFSEHRDKVNFFYDLRI